MLRAYLFNYHKACLGKDDDLLDTEIEPTDA